MRSCACTCFAPSSWRSMRRWSSMFLRLPLFWQRSHPNRMGRLPRGSPLTAVERGCQLCLHRDDLLLKIEDVLVAFCGEPVDSLLGDRFRSPEPGVARVSLAFAEEPGEERSPVGRMKYADGVAN